MLREHKSVVIQKHVRGWLARRRYRRTLRAVVYLQCCYRRMMAKRELKKLKIEARSVERYKKLHIGLENKIMQLQRKIDEQVKSSLASGKTGQNLGYVSQHCGHSQNALSSHCEGSVLFSDEEQ